MGTIGATELIIILFIVLLLFGATRLPQLFRSLGQASREYRVGLSEGGKEREAEETEKPGA